LSERTSKHFDLVQQTGKVLFWKQWLVGASNSYSFKATCQQFLLYPSSQHVSLSRQTIPLHAGLLQLLCSPKRFGFKTSIFLFKPAVTPTQIQLPHSRQQQKLSSQTISSHTGLRAGAAWAQLIFQNSFSWLLLMLLVQE
jgi:hypothetical protein